MRVLLGCFCLIFSLSGRSSLSESPVFPAHLSLVAGCRIFDTQATLVRTLPGEQCLFLKDGRYLSASEKALRLLTSAGGVQWELKGHFHHQLAWSTKRDHVHAIASEVLTGADKKSVRYDRLQVVNLDGVVVKEIGVPEILRQAKLAPLKYENHIKTSTDVLTEGSHINSFWEIPALKTTARLAPQWAAGNYVVNGLGHGLFVLDASLKKVLWHHRSPNALLGLAHDVQVTPQGHLLQFVNLAAGSRAGLHLSTVEEVDLATMKVRWQFNPRPAGIFYSRYGGGVHAVDDDLLLFSTSFGGVFLYSRNRKALVWSSDLLHLNHGQAPVYIQRAFTEDLRGFLASSVTQ